MPNIINKDVNDAANYAANKTRNAVDKARETANNIVNTTRETANNIVNTTRETADNMANKTREAADNVTNKANDAINTARQNAQNVANEAHEKDQAIRNDIKNTADTVVDNDISSKSFFDTNYIEPLANKITWNGHTIDYTILRHVADFVSYGKITAISYLADAAFELMKTGKSIIDLDIREAVKHAGNIVVDSGIALSAYAVGELLSENNYVGYIEPATVKIIGAIGTLVAGTDIYMQTQESDF